MKKNYNSSVKFSDVFDGVEVEDKEQHSKWYLRNIRRISKIIDCPIIKCGDFIELSVDEHTVKLDDKTVVYAGKCKKCGKAFRIKKSDADLLRLTGKPTIKVIPTTFDTMFE